MGDSDDSKKITTTAEMENLSLGSSTNRFSRDLLQRFMVGGSQHEKAAKEDDEGIELNLGLSLGGRFGVEKSSMNLVRSSSVASCLPLVGDDNDVVAPSTAAYAGLVRTSSLPVETEEEWRKRKKLQTLRRMEAKRRRSEKQRNLKGDKEVGGSVSRGKLSLEEFSYKGKGSYVGKGLGAMESKRESSLLASDLESKTLEGSSVESLQEGSNHDISSSGYNTRENTSRATGDGEPIQASPQEGREIPTNSMDDMPCVFTVGDGPNGRRR
ncbi:UNVERIFIED_CONTAM: Ninja-family protein AFP2 [Sesamum radiatum]|uniref:Ninja-family protein n=1 Tax=Sesamum radiatum TaxID=300843 RepID=A0AAW2TZJ3_SESRA